MTSLPFFSHCSNPFLCLPSSKFFLKIWVARTVHNNSSWKFSVNLQYFLPNPVTKILIIIPCILLSFWTSWELPNMDLQTSVLDPGWVNLPGIITALYRHINTFLSLTKPAIPIHPSFTIFNLTCKKRIFLVWKLKMWTENWALLLGQDGCLKKQRKILRVSRKRVAIFWDLGFYNFPISAAVESPTSFWGFLFTKCITEKWKKDVVQLNSEFSTFWGFFPSVCPPGKKE